MLFLPFRIYKDDARSVETYIDNIIRYSNRSITIEKMSEIIYKIIVIGDPQVGKTSLLTKYAKKKFTENYIRTLGSNITKQMVNLDNGTHIDLLVWDIAGQREVSEMFPSYFDGANGAIIVFDFTRPKTLANVSVWYKECLKNNIGHIPMLLVGNKIDLERKIPDKAGKEIADRLNFPYFETSAKTGINVDRIFESCAKNIYDYERKHKQHL